MEDARAHQLREGPARPECACLARRFARPVSQREGRRPAVREAPNALALAERACLLAEGDEADAVVTAERSGLARFADSAVHQPTLVEDRSVGVRVVRDGRIGCATTNRLDDAGLRALVARAAEIADRAPVDPGFPGLPDRAAPPDVEGWDEETAAHGPADQAERAWAAIEAAGDLGLYGYYTSGETELAVASTRGVAVSQAITDVAVLALAAGDGRSGYADASSWRAGDIDPAAVARDAAEKAARTERAGEVEPQTFRAVLEPYAFAELLWYFGYSSLGALGLLEERSYLSGRMGEQAFDEAFSLYDDGLDPAGLPKAFDFEGVPKRCVPIVKNGVVTDVVWDCRTASRAGARASGVQPLGRARRRVGGGARLARRRRDLRHAAPLPEHRRSARGADHGDDARRHVPDRERPCHRAARQPTLHDLVPGPRRLVARPRRPRTAREPERFLRRALPVRRRRACGRDRSLHRHRLGLGARALDQIEEPDRRAREQRGDDDRETRQVPLDDVLAALRGRGEANPAESRIAPRVHEDERHEGDREEDMDGCDESEHVLRIAARPRPPSGSRREARRAHAPS